MATRSKATNKTSAKHAPAPLGTLDRAVSSASMSALALSGECATKRLQPTGVTSSVFIREWPGHRRLHRRDPSEVETRPVTSTTYPLCSWVLEAGPSGPRRSLVVRACSGEASYFGSSTMRSSGSPPAYIFAESKNPDTETCIRTSPFVLFCQNHPCTPVLGAMNDP